MKWLNQFTADVYNAIDPYLFITVVHSGGGFRRWSSTISRTVDERIEHVCRESRGHTKNFR